MAGAMNVLGVVDILAGILILIGFGINVLTIALAIVLIGKGAFSFA